MGARSRSMVNGAWRHAGSACACSSQKFADPPSFTRSVPSASQMASAVFGQEVPIVSGASIEWHDWTRGRIQTWWETGQGRDYTYKNGIRVSFIYCVLIFFFEAQFQKGTIANLIPLAFDTCLNLRAFLAMPCLTVIRFSQLVCASLYRYAGKYVSQVAWLAPWCMLDSRNLVHVFSSIYGSIHRQACMEHGTATTLHKVL